jgi:hypothetical protein
MPGFLLDALSTISCLHAGRVQAVVPNPRVLINGVPAVTMAAPHAVVGCIALSPCVAAQWVIGATRVFAGGAPVLVQSSQALCPPTASPVVVIITQTRVAAV